MAGPGKPKTGGRAKGTPNKVATEIRDLAQRLLADDKYRAALRKRLLEGKAGPIEVQLWYYAYGKPKDTVAHEGKVMLPPLQIVPPPSSSGGGM
jgi:hypothetical protein